ncbi:MAG TPA: single-stranded DNA-binding protein [Chloroflexota bacterium]|nr:single-stranded DNA-binding protein [Chloroflexota bacterium]
MGLNRVTLMGNVGATPALRYTGAGQAVLNLRIATNDRWTDKSGEVHDRVEWHDVVVWGPRASGLVKHVHKGSALLIEGRLETRSYEDKDKVRRYRTEVVATNVLFAGEPRGKGDDARGDAHEPIDEPPPTQSPPINGNGHAGPAVAVPYQDDIPF